ncbi:MAG: cation diffusion facilitator family transporter [Chloroflexia bacterium]
MQGRLASDLDPIGPDPAHDDGHQHDHDQDNGHDHDHDHDHDHSHAHNEASGPLGFLQTLLPFGHGHSHGDLSIDESLASSDRGIWAIKVSLALLGVTALVQFLVYLASGSVGLLADTIHNASDALTAVPLWIAFNLSKRPPTRRFTYGYGRAEDLAGVAIVLVILASALLALYEAVTKLLHPSPLTNLPWVAAASIVGFIGNEAVAQLRIRTGSQIGSAALVADGQHARADGFTSLAVLAGVIGVALGFPLADPIAGLLISVVILFILKDTVLSVGQRLVDAVDPSIVDRIEALAATVPGVCEVHDVRVRWLGHMIEAELHVTVDEDLSTRESHRILEEVRHLLLHKVPKLAVVNVHADPCGHSGEDPHELTAHH